jgi:hypothetical protein
MRTTITLEDDVAAAIEQLRRVDGRSLRAVVNELLRIGLARSLDQSETAPAFRTRSVSLGGCRLPDVDDVAEVLAIAEGEDRR